MPFNIHIAQVKTPRSLAQKGSDLFKRISWFLTSFNIKITTGKATELWKFFTVSFAQKSCHQYM